jgi:hypothetical protein
MANNPLILRSLPELQKKILYTFGFFFIGEIPNWDWEGNFVRRTFILFNHLSKIREINIHIIDNF